MTENNLNLNKVLKFNKKIIKSSLYQTVKLSKNDVTPFL